MLLLSVTVTTSNWRRMPTSIIVCVSWLPSQCARIANHVHGTLSVCTPTERTRSLFLPRTPFSFCRGCWHYLRTLHYLGNRGSRCECETVCLGLALFPLSPFHNPLWRSSSRFSSPSSLFDEPIFSCCDGVLAGSIFSLVGGFADTCSRYEAGLVEWNVLRPQNFIVPWWSPRHRPNRSFLPFSNLRVSHPLSEAFWSPSYNRNLFDPPIIPAYPVREQSFPTQSYSTLFRNFYDYSIHCYNGVRVRNRPQKTLWLENEKRMILSPKLNVWLGMLRI